MSEALRMERHSHKDGKQVNYSALRKSFKLVDDSSEGAGDEVAALYAGYAPLSVRVVQSMLRSEGGRSLEDVRITFFT